MHIAMLPGVAMVKILENDLWMNSFLVKYGQQQLADMNSSVAELPFLIYCNFSLIHLLLAAKF